MKDAKLLKTALSVAAIGLTIQMDCALGGVTSPAGINSSTAGENVDISENYPTGVISTTTESPLQTGIGVASGGQASWTGGTLAVSADRYGLYSENEDSLISINTQSGKLSVVSTYVPANKFATADNYGIWAADSGKVNVIADSVAITVDRQKQNQSVGIYVENNGSVILDSSSIMVSATNAAKSFDTQAYALRAESSGTIELGNENASSIFLISTAQAGTEYDAKYRTNGTILATDSSSVSLNAAEITLQANGFNPTGVEAKEGSQITVGNEKSNISISTIGVSQVVGVRTEHTNSSVNILADTVSIYTENTSEEGFSVGLYALNNSDDSSRPKNSASINITANQTSITSDGVGISAYSNSQVKLDTGLTLNAPTAIEARGNSLVNINPNNNKTVVIKGDVSFGTAAEDSGKILNAEVNINLTGAESSWTGNIKVDYPTDSGVQTDITDGVTLALSNKAQWTPTKVSESDAGGQIVKTQSLNVLNLNDGIVNVNSDVGTLEIKELQGAGGVINAEATKDESGAMKSSIVKIDQVNTAGDANPVMTVNYTGITADYLVNTADDMKTLADQTIQVGEDGSETQGAVDQTFNVAEGNIKGAVTSAYDADGNLKTTQSKNVKLTDYGALNAMTLVQWRNEINHLTKRLGDIRASESNIGAWARVYGGESQWSSNSEIEMDLTTIQVGGDYRVNNHWIVGGAFSYTDSDADLVKGQAEGDSYSLAAYATYMADGGSYLDLIARYGYLDNELTSGNMHVDTESNAFSLSVETGHMFRILEQAYIEPQIEVTYGFISGDDTTASNGVKLDQDDFQSLITRVGVRTGFDFPENAGTFYAMLSYSYDFLGDADGTASQGGYREALSEDLGGGWVTYGVGAQFKLGDSAFAYGELERTSGGDIDNPYLFSAGVRMVF